MFQGTIRALQKKDREAVEKIYDLYWSDDFRDSLAKKMEDFVGNQSEMNKQGLHYCVAEEKGEVVGIAGFRKAPPHMQQYARTENPAELYILAVKNKRKGIGSALRAKMIQEAKALGYAEAVFYSGQTHKEGWDFHDTAGGEQVGNAVAPNGELGKVWRLML